VTQAKPSLAGFEVEKVVADKAYDSRTLIEMIHDHGAQAVIPPHANSQHPGGLISRSTKLVNPVERFFSRIEHFQRVATRYDKLDECYLTFVMKTLILICLA